VSGVIRWEDPPSPDPRGGYRNPHIADWSLVAAQLRDRPGRWGVVSERAQSGVAVNIREGKLAGFKPAGSFDAKNVRVNGLLTLYARYIGEPS
jgi:hypothetical protein